VNVEEAITPHRLLREYLRADSPQRERAVARFMAVAGLACIPFVLVLVIFQGWTAPLLYTGIIGTLVTYELLLTKALDRGWYHPAIPWVNVLLEISIPVPILAVATLQGDAVIGVSSEAYVIWGALIALSAARCDPRLSVAAGLLAAVEFFVLYRLLMMPHLPDEPIVTLRLPSILLRSSLLFISGTAGALIAQLFIRKASEALRSVREQDLMGKYFLHERIGTGGMAEVYRATYCPEGGFRKTVAIKRVLSGAAASMPEFNEMFVEEARLCALLHHPNIVQVFDCGKYQGGFIVAMEYVDGPSLQALIRTGSGPLPISAVTFIGAELASALDYIHRKVAPDGKPLNLVHRDVNPPNILISRIGEVKLSDFGVASAATRVGSQSGRFYGKVVYAAPEQMRSDVLDARTDLFALGLTLHEALTGRRVLNGDVETLMAGGHLPPIPRPSFLRAEVPEALDRLVMQLLEPLPESRPATGAEVRERLVALTGPAAPFPEGQRALMRAIDGVRAVAITPKSELATSAQVVTGSQEATQAASAHNDVTRVAGR